MSEDETRAVGHTPVRSRRRWGRTLLRLFLLVAIPAVAVVGGGAWYASTGRYVTTENAYVKAHVIAVSPDVDGRVTNVLVEENQRVNAGDLLFTLDQTPHLMLVRRAEAQRENARHSIEAMRAEFHQIKAETLEAESAVDYYRKEAQRQRELARKAVTTRSRLEEAEHNLRAANRRVATLNQKIRTVLARLGGNPSLAAELHPDFLAAETEISMARMNLSYTEVRAPIDGVVTRLRLEPGEWVEEGQPAFGLIAIDRTWIEANLKETQLTHVKEGQTVEVEVDAYPDVVWLARVASISPATGAEFSVLPPQNASGNWVKVVQRLPVRIELEHRSDHPPLRAGMTATVTIDTKFKRELWNSVKRAVAG